MEYIKFSLLFVLVHTGAYLVAGLLAYRISRDLYHGENRLLDFLKDMSDESENARVAKLALPLQFLRGLLLSIVLYPIMGLLGELSYLLRFIFLASLMFVYTDFASAIPFPHNIEGFIYLKERYLKKSAFWKLQFEMIIFSLLFGLVSGWFLFS
jgi:hypothetical protein